MATIDGRTTIADIRQAIEDAEAEAIATFAAGLREAVAGLVEHPDCLCGEERSPTISRAEVLALLPTDNEGAASE